MSKSAVRGTMSTSILDTVAAGTTVSYRVVARVATNAPAAGVNMTFTGKVEITTP